MGLENRLYLKILMTLEHPDAGSISRRQGLRVGYASQVPEFLPKTVEQVLMDAVPERGGNGVIDEGENPFRQSAIYRFFSACDRTIGWLEKKIRYCQGSYARA